MVKSKAAVERKMRERVSTAGTYLKEGMSEAPDPVDVLLSDVAGNEKKLVDGVAEAVRRGKYKAGLETAKARGSWKGSQDRAAAHYEERAEDMVKHSMEGYDERANCIEAAKASIKSMPSTTRDQRIARGAAYAKAMGACMDRVKGLK
jgi:hypothetical protein